MWANVSGNQGTLLPWGVVIAAAGVAAVLDVRSRQIPNALTGPLLLSGLSWSLYAHGREGLEQSTLAMLLLALPFVLLWLIGAGGAGDAKMMAAIGCWLGFPGGITALLAVAFAGGILALVTALIHQRLVTTLLNLPGLGLGLLSLMHGVTRLPEKNVSPPQPDPLRMPYGIAIFVGVCAAAAWRLS